MSRPKPSLDTQRPSSEPRPSLIPSSSPSSRAAQQLSDGKARIVIDVPIATHRALKVKAAQQGRSIKEYVLSLLESEGIS
jgi:hypothetical protein